MQDTRKPSRWVVALVACGLAAAGCQLFVDLDGLEDRSCPPGAKACNDECVSERDTATGCGDPGCNPCAPQHADAICDQNNHCSFNRASCIDPWYDCNGFEDDGCEKDLAHDPDHCGECFHACADPPHGIAGCSKRQCVIGKCSEGWEDCDRDPSNGCERQIWTDTDCVSCDVPCAEGSSCDRGVCLQPVSE